MPVAQRFKLMVLRNNSQSSIRTNMAMFVSGLPSSTTCFNFQFRSRLNANSAVFHEAGRTRLLLVPCHRRQPPFIHSNRHSRGTTKLACAAAEIQNEDQDHRTRTPPASSTLWMVISQTVTLLFPVWTSLASILALRYPQLFLSISDQYVTLMLSALMFSMGTTLSWSDLRHSFRNRTAIMVNFVGCYGVMPALSVALSHIAGLDREFTAGMVLLGMVSGGQASNLCTYIANGDVALSVTMTTMTTLSAIFMLPFLSLVLLGEVIPVHPAAIAWSTVSVVLLPIALGIFLSRLAPGMMKHGKPFLPLVGVVSTVLIVLSAVSRSHMLLSSSLSTLLLPVLLLHILGGVYGLVSAKLAKLKQRAARAMAIEVMFKSPALALVLASKHFAGMGVRIPAAVSIFALAPLAALFSVMLRFAPIRDE